MSTNITDQLLNFVFDHAVRKDPRSVIDAIDGYSRDNGGMIHLVMEKGAIFDQIVRRSGASRVLELGTNYGYSAMRMALNLGDTATIHTIEVNQVLADTASAIITYAGLEDRIEVICGPAGQIIGGFSEPFDLVFIDHYPENYFPDLQLIEHSGLLGDGATVVTDNVVMFESRLGAYLEHLRNGGNYHSALHQPSPGSDGIEVSERLTRAA